MTTSDLDTNKSSYELVEELYRLKIRYAGDVPSLTALLGATKRMLGLSYLYHSADFLQPDNFFSFRLIMEEKHRGKYETRLVYFKRGATPYDSTRSAIEEAVLLMEEYITTVLCVDEPNPVVNDDF